VLLPGAHNCKPWDNSPVERRPGHPRHGCRRPILRFGRALRRRHLLFHLHHQRTVPLHMHLARRRGHVGRGRRRVAKREGCTVQERMSLPFVAEYDNMLRCIRCAACLTSCPTYVVTHKEEEGPRGRISIMRAFVEGHLEITPDGVEHLEPSREVVHTW